MGPKRFQQGLIGQLAELSESVESLGRKFDELKGGVSELVERVEETNKQLVERVEETNKQLVERVEETNNELADLREEVGELGLQIDKANKRSLRACRLTGRLLRTSETRFKTLHDAVSQLSANQRKGRIEAQKRHNRANREQWVPVHNAHGELPRELPALEREVDLGNLDRSDLIAYLDFYERHPNLEATDLELAMQLQRFLIGL
ncbi:hypothetical protein FRC08_016782 [Ceratobasidium sp. 394]|nr:hypothetical protein FRC08_016782 [Ceratobasidium sp. 394]KAG9097612.1 hypothetical protein FS749_005902 [Ceratobasidium sp. UAMH 11750]